MFPSGESMYPPDCSGTASGLFRNSLRSGTLYRRASVAHTEAEKNRECFFQARYLRKIIGIDAPGDEHSAAPHEARRRCNHTGGRCHLPPLLREGEWDRAAARTIFRVRVRAGRHCARSGPSRFRVRVQKIKIQSQKTRLATTY